MRFKRSKQNPILKPINNSAWEAGAVFNCGVASKGALIHLVYRAIGEYSDCISRLGYAVSKDGVNFKRNKKPILEPTEPYDKWGCEDPRITKIGDRFYITYVALCKPPREGGGPPRTALASTTDFTSLEKHGIITPEGSNARDTVLFPERINGKYVMLHRPHNWTQKDTYTRAGKLLLHVKERVIEWPIEEIPARFPKKPSIWIAYSNNLKGWFGHKIVMEPTEKWESLKIGASPPPIKTKKGWLLIYHGVEKIPPNSKFRNHDGKIYTKVYRTGAALLDLNDPSKIIGKTKKPIFEPERDYEVFGNTPNVVFPEGMVVRDKTLYVYYGAADKTCCLATCKLDNLISFLLNERKFSS